MKDLIGKLTNLEASAPKAPVKKNLTEDTSKRELAKKPTLKDMFNALSENVAPGQKPLPVMDPTNKKAGMGFVTSSNPSVQNILKNLDPKDVQIVQAPGQTGQQTQPTQQATQQTQGGQGQSMGATAKAGGAPANMQGGQTMQEDDLDERDEGKPGKNFAKIAKSAAKRYGSKEAGERVAGAVRAKLAKQGKLEEGPKVDRMVKHIEKSERKLGKSKEKASDIAWATANKRGMLDNKNKKVKEADIPSTQGIDTKGAGLGAGRSMTTLEAKEPQVEVIDNAFNRENYKDLIGKKYPKSKAPAYARVKEISEGAKPDFLDLDKDGNKKESMKKAAADKKKKQKVKESMNHRISAARLEGKSHGLKGHAHCGKNFEDLEERKAYCEGYKDGLDECYGMGVYETAPAMPAATLHGMDDDAMDEAELDENNSTILRKMGQSRTLRKYVPGLGRNEAGERAEDERANAGWAGEARPTYYDGTPNPNYKADKAEAGRSQRAASRYNKIAANEEGNAFTGALARTPKGGKFSLGGKTFTDRTSYDAPMHEGDYAFESWNKQLNSLVNEGLSVSVSKGNDGAEDSVNINATGPESEELLQLVKSAGLGLFGDEEHHEPSSAMSLQPSHGEPNEVGAGSTDIDVVDDSDSMLSLMKKLGGVEQSGSSDYADEEDCGCEDEEETNEATCNECGMMESECGCSHKKEMVDETESEDQMEYEVAEDNGAANSTNDEKGNAAANASLAKADSDDEEEDDLEESFTFESIYKKLDMIAESAEEDEEDEENEEDEEDEEDVAEGLNEWANDVGKKGTDTSFEQDIDFMTKVISGGLNKPKSTGQTTVPVVAGQLDRMQDSPKDWATLAGIKKA